MALPPEASMIELRDKQDGKVIGSVTEQQLQFLVDQLEEESRDDRDYYLNRDTLDMFAEQGIDDQLLSLLRKALADREEMEIVWAGR